MEYLRQSDVSPVRNVGWPTRRESHGHGVPMVVDGVTSIQGDGNAVHRAKWDREARLESRRGEVSRNATA